MTMYHPSNDLPASFDVTPLLSKLESTEKKSSAGSDLTAKKGGHGDLIQRVKLIELDPYHTQTSENSGEKTRLFLAVAYGKKAVVAQLFALELGRIEDDDGIGTGEGGGSDAEEELEWIDVSERRLLSHQGKEDGDPIVVFPPSYAESLPSFQGEQKSDQGEIDGTFTAEITSCALIPTPLVRSTSSNSTSRVMTQRTVAVMLGTSNDRVLSLLLTVNEKTMNSSHPSASTDKMNVRFVLNYDECKVLENGGLKDRRGKADRPGENFANKYPCVHQILPLAKRLFGPEYNNEASDGYSDNFHHYNGSNGHVQMFHPSLPSSSSQHDAEEGDENKEVKYSGIRSISYCRDTNSKSRRYSNGFVGDANNNEVTMNQDIIWITFGNGTIVKLPSWRPFLMFPTVSGGDDDDDDVDDDDDDDDDNANNMGNGSSVVPLNTPFQSPLDVPPPHTGQRSSAASPGDAIESMDGGGRADEYWNLLSLAVSSTWHQHSADHSMGAMILSGGSAPASTSSITLHSSRITCDPSSATSFDQRTELSQQGDEGGQSHDNEHERGDDHFMDTSYEDEQFGPVTGNVVDDTAALVKGALGMALGAVRWGFGSSGAAAEQRAGQVDNDDTPLDEFMEVDDHDSADHGMALPEQLHSNQKVNGHHDLFPWPPSAGTSFPFSDVPRRFETATVDPSGNLVATTDNLGRVMLFDMETNQPIRMFKGMRNASCHFSEVPCGNGSNRSYLVIHLKQRGAVEVYRMRQGPQLSAVAVPPREDCAVMECQGPLAEGGGTCCFLLERTDGAFAIDKLVIDDPDAAAAATQKQMPSRPMFQSENKMQLTLLLQLLAPDTNIQCNVQTVLTTYKSIRGLADLGEGLDALSRSDRCVEDGSSLHSQAVAYCKLRLEQAKQVEALEGSGAVRKSVISELASTVAYHDRLVKSYDVLNRYESKHMFNGTSGGDDPGSLDNMKALPSWASEALSWISAASENDAVRTRFTSSYHHADSQGDNKPLAFSKFAMSCQANGDNDRVYLTKIKRGRLPILLRVFRPLLQDLFVFKVVNSLFSKLGIDEDFEILQQYFGEWVSSLPTHDIAKSNMTGTWHPMIRWLQELIISAYDACQNEQQKSGSDFLRKAITLDSLMKFITQMDDLPKAFLLSVICMEAVSSASVQLEQKTYGKITQLECIKPWEDVLRKLRVCLLVSLRLAGDVSPITGGADSMTVSNVSRPDVFSIYSWIARDELCLSHDCRVIMALENACLSSSEAFYPSTAHGDSPQNKTTIFQSCADYRGSPYNPTGLTNDTQSRPLLFYLKDYARFATRLAANRALILATMWGKLPQELDLLKQTISTLRIIVDSVEEFSLATLAEIYQSRIRPICRAMLFGFGDHELSEEKIYPLVTDKDWSLDFIAAVKQILSMIIECMSKTPTANSTKFFDSSEMWPPLRECPILSVLAKKLHNIHPSSVELHHTVIFAFEMTGSIDSLESVVPSFSNLFSIGSLFSEMQPMAASGAPEQQGLLDKAITDYAVKSSSPVIDGFSCIRSCELFGKSLGVDVKYVHTEYLIEMIRLGKDASINDLLGASISLLDKTLFTQKVLPIICTRLHATILSLKKTKNYRGILSLLDADASRWVKEEAAKCSPSRKNSSSTASLVNTNSSLINTHSLVMRVQSISENLDSSLAKKVDALSLMSSTLLKAVQAQEREAVMSV